MRRILVILALLCTIAVFAEYKIIQRAEDGRYYLDEESVLLLANYIKQLEELNQNYRTQIVNLEQQVKVLKDLLELEKAQRAALENEVAKLQAELEKRKLVTWTVVAAIAIGTVVLLFVR